MCVCVCARACVRARVCVRVRAHTHTLRGLTQRPQLHGDVHVAVLRAVVHGLLQGLGARPAQSHGPLAATALAGRIALFHALSQDLLQGQHVRFGLLWLRQELPQNIPGGKETKEGDVQGSRHGWCPLSCLLVPCGPDGPTTGHLQAQRAHGLPFPGRLGPGVSQRNMQKTPPFCCLGTAEKS